jgi:hypothetical protein
MYVPLYQRDLDLMVKLRDSLSALTLFVGCICWVMDDTKNLDIVYLIAFSAIVGMAMRQGEVIRRQRMINKLKER